MINRKNNFNFNIGDELLFIGHYLGLESGILKIPVISDTIIFQFAYNIPCPEAPIVDYGDQIYNTVQIFNQCWLNENLNIGFRINNILDQEDNSVIEKYCYNNDFTKCDIYGGLYQWDEMMQYVEIQGVQGICPTDWHIPTDNEWKILEGGKQ